MLKRIGFFLLTNLAILIVLSIVLNIVSAVFGINFGNIAGANQNMGSLLVFAAVVGFTGSLISLFMSKTIAKHTMGVQMITQPTNKLQAWLLETVHSHAQKAGIGMPEVGIYEGEANAFATGASRNNAMVAVSTGLLSSMNKEEVEAVLAHEIAHVANGDMVTLTLIQGVTNTFVVFLSRIIGNFVDRAVLRNESDAPGIGYYVTSVVLDIVLGILAAIVVAYFSRHREFRADAGAAKIMGSTTPMINALARLGSVPTEELPPAVKGFGIAGSIGELLASHPSIQDRIKALRDMEVRR
ncbi:protease HtpX [Turicimonas muris]|uniref:protease HtpX n=1 Tax=Turicimonas muris TaxID=1796652 RepID=UPI0023F1CF8E|nr:protease HtpX [Turicimonas muris]